MRPRAWKTRHIAAWRRDRRGATLLEFAVIGPIFLLLVFGVMEFSVELLTQALLDQAINSAARNVQIGSVKTQSDYKASVCNQMILGFIKGNCNALSLSVYTGSSYSGLSAHGGDFGSGGNYVRVHTALSFTNLLPMMAQFQPNGSSRFDLVSEVAFKNEP